MIARLMPRAAMMAALLFALPLPASAETPFNAQEKEAIETIVRDYLVQHPEVMLDVLDALDAYQDEQEAKKTQAVIAANRDALEHDGYSYVAGNPDGDVTVVEFFDYNCGYCKHVTKDVRQLIEEDDQVRLVLKELPILYDESTFASKAAIASMLQDKYLDFHFALLGHKGKAGEQEVMAIAESVGIDTDRLRKDMQDPKIDEMLDQNKELAFAIGVRGTPGFVIGDKLIPGAADLSRLKKDVEEARTGCTSC